MATLQPILCPLSQRPKTFYNNGLDLINGQWVQKQNCDNHGRVKSHKPEILKQKDKYYV